MRKIDKNMIKIGLEKCIFKAYHGLYQDEKKYGNEFVVDVEVGIESHQINHLSDTIDYSKIYEIVKDEMQNPRELLEVLAQEIIEKIFILSSKICFVSLKISKKNPPIQNSKIENSYIKIKQYK